MERRSDHRVSTLRKLVEALGGELEARDTSPLIVCVLHTMVFRAKDPKTVAAVEPGALIDLV